MRRGKRDRGRGGEGRRVEGRRGKEKIARGRDVKTSFTRRCSVPVSLLCWWLHTLTHSPLELVQLLLQLLDVVAKGGLHFRQEL